MISSNIQAMIIKVAAFGRYPGCMRAVHLHSHNLSPFVNVQSANEQLSKCGEKKAQIINHCFVKLLRLLPEAKAVEQRTIGRDKRESSRWIMTADNYIYTTLMKPVNNLIPLIVLCKKEERCIFVSCIPLNTRGVQQRLQSSARHLGLLNILKRKKKLVVL